MSGRTKLWLHHLPDVCLYAELPHGGAQEVPRVGAGPVCRCEGLRSADQQVASPARYPTLI